MTDKEDLENKTEGKHSDPSEVNEVAMEDIA
jgi:hypothetical protein